MRQKKKISRRYYPLIIIATLFMMLAGGAAFAANTNPTTIIDDFGNICPDSTGLTARFSICIQATVTWALNSYLGVYMGYFVDSINAAFILATIFYGIMVFIGRASPAREGVMLLIKIGFVMFLINMGNFLILFPALIDTINWMVGIVTNYTAINLSPHCTASSFIWDRVDCALNMLIGGITSGRSIATGLSAFAISMLFSKGVGMMVAIFIAGIIIKTILAVMHALFILLSAYIALALLSLLAPLIIPLVLFSSTKAYFEKWLKMLIGVMLQPVFLFAYLAIFLIALEVSLFTGPHSVYRSITCDFSTNPQPAPADVDAANFSIGNFLLSSGAIQRRTGAEGLATIAIGQNSKTFGGTAAGTTTQQGGYTGKNAVKSAGKDGATLLNSGIIVIDIGVDALNIDALANRCNMSAIDYITQLILSLFAAAAVIYIFSTMIHVIPYLGTLISGDLFGLPNLSNVLPTSSLAGSNFISKLGFGKQN